MTPEHIDFVADLVKSTSGLVITREKGYLVESRLSPLARRKGCESLAEFLDHVMKTRDSSLCEAITEAMTTNETFFFRDKTPFETFENHVLPTLLENAKPGRKIRIWTAAASSGQELYSIAMILNEQRAKLKGATFELIGTDISKEILEKARAGLYSQFEVQRGLPVKLLVNYFKKEGELWRINEEMRAQCVFREANLLHDFKGLGQFDVVFCRNVLIYFDQETKKDVLERIAAQMPENGFLFLGAAETVMGVTTAFTPARDHRGLYMRNPEFQAASGRSAA